MAKQRKSGVKTWTCKYGCKLTKTPCKHLEGLISDKRESPLFESVNSYAGNKVDRNCLKKTNGKYKANTTFTLTDRAKEKINFIKSLGNKLTPIETDILVLRYVYDETFSTIAKELKLIGTEQVIRLHNESLKKLKERMNQ